MTCDVSVVIPTYNRRDVVAESVSSVLDQTVPPAEVIVVDHGSTDGTPAMLLERFGTRIHLERLAHEGGIGHVRNAGVARSTRTWLAFLDHDDAWLPGKLERQLTALEQSGASWSLSGFIMETHRPDGRTESEVRRLELEGRDPYEEILAYRCPALVQGMVVSRSLAIRIGGFNPSLTLLDDLDFALRLARSGPAAVCAEPLFRYRKEPRPWGPKESSRHHREMLRVLAEDASRPPKGRGKELLRANAAAHWKAVASAEWHAGNRPSSVVGLFRSAVARFVGP